jgi:hypothetical protein
MTAGYIAEAQVADASTDKTLHVVPDFVKHAANLSIYSLPQHNSQTRGRDGVKSRNPGALAIEENSAQQFRRECRVPRPIQRRFIFLVDLVTWVGKPLRQFAIICEKEQTFSLRVQAADAEEPGEILWKEIKDRVARVLILSSRNKSRGFVQHDGKRWSGANNFAIDLDVVVHFWLCAEVCADFAVDGDATRRDQFVTMSARANAGSGEKTIKAQDRGYRLHGQKDRPLYL